MDGVVVEALRCALSVQHFISRMCSHLEGWDGSIGERELTVIGCTLTRHQWLCLHSA